MARPKGEPRKQTCFTLDTAILQRLQDYSDRTYVPKAKVIQLAIVEYLDKMEDNNK